MRRIMLVLVLKERERGESVMVCSWASESELGICYENIIAWILCIADRP